MLVDLQNAAIIHKLNPICTEPPIDPLRMRPYQMCQKHSTPTIALSPISLSIQIGGGPVTKNRVQIKDGTKKNTERDQLYSCGSL